MAIYENKFVIGDEVFTKDNKYEYPRYTRMADLLFATNFCESLQQAKCKVVNYGLHPRNRDFIYLVEDEKQHQYLFGEEGIEIYNGQDKGKVEQSPKQQYKQRAKWVMNIGEKPDLPDGTLVKVVFDEGGVIAEVDKLRWSIADNIGQQNVVKWKLADDWNKVVDGQAPDIDGETLIDVKFKDKFLLENTTVQLVCDWNLAKKWRYAKEKKAK